jgi:hypothetical protein
MQHIIKRAATISSQSRNLIREVKNLKPADVEKFKKCGLQLTLQILAKLLGTNYNTLSASAHHGRWATPDTVNPAIRRNDSKFSFGTLRLARQHEQPFFHRLVLLRIGTFSCARGHFALMEGEEVVFEGRGYNPKLTSW